MWSHINTKQQKEGNRMSERFVSEGKDILQYGEWWCSAGGEHCADVIATALNMITDENEGLKNMVGYSYEEHKRCVDNYVDKIKEVEKENDELKQEIKQLQFRIIDMLDFIKENDGVTRQEMKEWWNNKLEFYYKFIK